MAPKVKGKVCEKKRSKKMISMEVKHEIIEKHERGVRITDMASEYGRSASTISTIINTMTLMTAIAVRFFAITVVHDRITFISRNKRFV